MNKFVGAVSAAAMLAAGAMMVSAEGRVAQAAPTSPAKMAVAKKLPAKVVKMAQAKPLKKSTSVTKRTPVIVDAPLWKPGRTGQVGIF